ncbi:MAG: thioredoxin domain-containing protein, partial [archaeon]|nr:thioredoxin domain-containing protein [archaeon]
AGKAAEAAAQQGKFWEMHDVLFEKQREWAGDPFAAKKFLDYAVAMEFDLDRFGPDMDSAAAAAKVESDRRGGFNAGVNSTPTFFLQGEKISNPRDYASFRALILQALEETAS